MRKSTMTMAVATLAISLLIVGATLAWFTSEGEVTNLFATGDVAITLHDLLETEEATGDFPSEGISNVTPGDSYGKQVYVSSQGSIGTYVRVRLTPQWEFENQLANLVNLDTDMVLLNLDTENWVFIGGWYYYKGILQQGDQTTLLLDGLTFSPEMGNEYANGIYTLEVEAEGIQATNDAINSAWGVNPLTWEAINP
jgi:predicted ribosomally synthesized peptide with SipW-like signal peptide